MADVLVVVAHPDDESLFAGGYISLLTQNGKSVHVIACSDGVLSRWYGKGRGWVAEKIDAKNNRADQFEAACALLGATGRVHRMFDDQMSDLTPQIAINTDVAEQIAKHKPDTVITHHVGDLNVDHRRVAEAVLVATRMSGARVLSMAPEFPSRCVGPAWNPDRRELIVTMPQKVRACLCYVDELRAYPHPRSERAIREQPVEWFMEIR